eukprot:COSAG01_NODE_6043_length_3882_cov_3.851042_8_plen_192_part_00
MAADATAHQAAPDDETCVGLIAADATTVAEPSPRLLACMGRCTKLSARRVGRVCLSVCLSVRPSVRPPGDWGNLANIYGHCDSVSAIIIIASPPCPAPRQRFFEPLRMCGDCTQDYGQMPLPWFIINSNGHFSTSWDLVQVVFLVYVAISVPSRVCVPLLSVSYYDCCCASVLTESTDGLRSPAADASTST